MLPECYQLLPSRALSALIEELPTATLLPDAVAWNACAAACAWDYLSWTRVTADQSQNVKGIGLHK